jgi:hypothetical protein
MYGFIHQMLDSTKPYALAQSDPVCKVRRVCTMELAPKSCCKLHSANSTPSTRLQDRTLSGEIYSRVPEISPTTKKVN